MNIKFKKPKVDTCHFCDKIKAKIDFADTKNSEAIESYKNQQASHHLEADLAYKAKEFDKVLSKNNDSIKTFTFDLQQCLPTPFLQTSVSFYKRQLWTFNLTVHDCATNSPDCFMWHEGQAKRGGNEIASCLLKHLKSLDIKGHVKSVIYYSDSCPGQNKNSFLSTMFLTFLKNAVNIANIHHKFLVPGHTHMECDVDHALIERKKKATQIRIHHPHDWYNFIRSVGIKNKFNVIEMKHSDFFEFSSYLKKNFLFRNRDENSNLFKWKDAKWLKYSKECFGKIFYKNSLDESEPFQLLNIQKRGINSVNITDVPKLPKFIPISTLKKKDLLDLLDMIDPCFHSFYTELPSDNISDMLPNLDSEEEEESVE